VAEHPCGDHRVEYPRAPLEGRVDEERLVERVRDRVPHADVVRGGALRVEHDPVVGGRGGGGDQDALRLEGGQQREVAGDHVVQIAVLQGERLHALVGDHVPDDPFDRGAPAVVAVVRFEYVPDARGELGEPVGAGADRAGAEVVAGVRDGAFVQDQPREARHDDRQERRGGGGEDDFDRVVVDHVHRVDDRERAAPAAAARRIAAAIEGELHVVRGERPVTAVPAGVGAEEEGVAEPILRDLPMGR
jgi:hypothetical protein